MLDQEFQQRLRDIRSKATYEPRFDIDLAVGAEPERYVQEVRSKFGTGSVEVKFDAQFDNTGNLYFETDCRGRDGIWRKSGVFGTKAEYWAHVLGYSGSFIVVPLSKLRPMIERMMLVPRNIKHERDGENPTDGVVLGLGAFIGLLRPPVDDRV